MDKAPEILEEVLKEEEISREIYRLGGKEGQDLSLGVIFSPLGDRK